MPDHNIEIKPLASNAEMNDLAVICECGWESLAEANDPELAKKFADSIADRHMFLHTGTFYKE
jgi:hypothetical protein